MYAGQSTNVIALVSMRIPVNDRPGHPAIAYWHRHGRCLSLGCVAAPESVHRTARPVDRSAREGLDSGMGSHGTMLMIAAASEESRDSLRTALREDGNSGAVTLLNFPLSRHWVRTAQ